MTRRTLLRAGGAATGALLVGATSVGARPVTRGPARRGTAPVGLDPISARYDFNTGWRFGGAYRAGAETPGFSDAGFARITLPHTVTPLSWGGWDPSAWEGRFIYRKRFSGAALAGGRTFLDFDGVMTDASVFLNGVLLAEHQGGFLPFSVELTGALLPGENDLGVIVDGRLLDVPPFGNTNGASSIDYLTPAGIHRGVTLAVTPPTFISDVFAKPVNVLEAPELVCAVSIESASTPRDRVSVKVELLDGTRPVAHVVKSVRLQAGTNLIHVSLPSLSGVRLWSPTSPKLYTVNATISGADILPHSFAVRTGFRQAVFELDGFFLNGERTEIFGLNRHGLYPFLGMAAPARLQARDALALKELNVNMVRCSHYPQSPAFLDACDGLGLMVWEEPPGWQYVGDLNFDAVFLQNVHDMIVRDRNRPSVVVWGTRLDETQSYPTLYGQARQIAYELDGTRQTSGAMNTQSTDGWAEDVFGFDDYGSASANVQIAPPVPGVPYVISEAVGAISGPPLYRWIDPSSTLATQARLHAQANQQARANSQISGVIAWAGIDYASLLGGGRNWENLRWPGVLDTFRVPKPGAAFYRSQLSPAIAPVIIPAFFWDFGPSSPATGPGPNTMLFTNCDELTVLVNGQLVGTATPDRTDFSNLAYPPVVVDLTISTGAALPDLQVIGSVAGRAVANLQMSSNPSRDRLSLVLDDSEIVADGSDATRATFRALDAYGNQRPYVSGDVSLSLSGPGQLVGDHVFAFEFYGGVGGAFVRSQVNRTGRVTLVAVHPTLGTATAGLSIVASPTVAL